MTPLKNTDHFDELAELIVEEKKKKKVCSLSRTAESRLLWAHYASGFTGVALEVELPDDDSRIHPVDYSGEFVVDLDSMNGTDAAANQILATKFSDWSYEDEVRIIQDQVWFKLHEPVKNVICGPRMNHAMFEALQIVCREKGIPISRMYIDEEGIDTSGERSPTMKLVRAFENKTKAQPVESGNDEAAPHRATS